MSRKLKFRPRITRVKLNPEQAVLACTCVTGITMWALPGRTGITFDTTFGGIDVCYAGSKGYYSRNDYWGRSERRGDIASS